MSLFKDSTEEIPTKKIMHSQFQVRAFRLTVHSNAHKSRGYSLLTMIKAFTTIVALQMLKLFGAFLSVILSLLYLLCSQKQTHLGFFRISLKRERSQLTFNSSLSEPCMSHANPGETEYIYITANWRQKVH